MMLSMLLNKCTIKKLKDLGLQLNHQAKKKEGLLRDQGLKVKKKEETVPHLRVLLLTLLLPPQARALHPQIQRVQSRKDRRQRVTKTNNTMDRSEKINDLGQTLKYQIWSYVLLLAESNGQFLNNKFLTGQSITYIKLCFLVLFKYFESSSPSKLFTCQFLFIYFLIFQVLLQVFIFLFLIDSNQILELIHLVFILLPHLCSCPKKLF